MNVFHKSALLLHGEEGKKLSFSEQYASAGSGMKGVQGRKKTSLQCSLESSRPGAAVDVLLPFKEAGINIHHISNRPRSYESKCQFQTMFLDVDAHISDPKMQKVVEALKTLCPAVSVVGSWNVPWYPNSIEGLDNLDQTTLAAGGDLQDDPENPHPGFHDKEYRARRKEIADNAMSYRYGQKIPEVKYTQQEIDAWSLIWDKLTALYPTHACRQYNRVLPLLIENAGYHRRNIPQLQDISEYLREATGFTVRPVTGLLTSRDFLNALAFRVFFSTQYIRHYSQPLYTPEPDVVHEVMGHVPLFADPDFADFSQAIGIASLGATEDGITELARCYWYTVEFGLCRQPGGIRAFGAGILSSFGELQYSLSDQPKYLPWDPFVAAKMPFPITKYQPTYFVADDFTDALKKLKQFTEQLDTPIKIVYNEHTKKVHSYPKSASAMLQDSDAKK